VLDTGHTKKYKQVNPHSKSSKKHTNQKSINQPYDSFANQFESISKLESPEKAENTMTFL